MKNDYDPSWHHNIICKKLEEVEQGKCKRLMLFLPPRHGKSLLASIMFPAWFLGKNPEKEIISCSYNDEFAEEFGRKARNIFKNETFNHIFRTSLSNDSKRVNRWSTAEGGGYVAAGVGGSITGRGADILIIDDPIKNREEADSPTYRQKTWDWYTSTAYTRLHAGGAVILILTRWHDDDLAGRILENEGEKWDVIKFPAIAQKKEKFRNKGEALWPQRYPLEELEQIKKSILLPNFAALYQQEPIISETQEFKTDWFQKWDTLPKNMFTITTVDPAISKKRTADDSVVMTCGMDETGRIYILEIKAGRLNPTEIIEEIFHQKEKWNSMKVGIETVAYQKALIHFMKLEMKKRQVFINIHEIKSRSSKESRIRALVPYYQNGMILHNHDSKDMEEQLTRFPNGRHDDIIDCLSMQLELLQKPGNKINRKRIKIQYHPVTGAVLGIHK